MGLFDDDFVDFMVYNDVTNNGTSSDDNFGCGGCLLVIVAVLVFFYLIGSLA